MGGVGDRFDVVPIPLRDGRISHTLRFVREMWEAAGSPPLNSAGRLKAEQRYLYDGWAQRRPGFYPADNPDSPWARLPHVRFLALDIYEPWRYRQALMNVGFRFPLDGTGGKALEPWHAEVVDYDDIRNYPLIDSIPASAGQEEDDMYTDDDRERDDATSARSLAILTIAKRLDKRSARLQTVIGFSVDSKTGRVSGGNLADRVRALVAAVKLVGSIGATREQVAELRDLLEEHDSDPVEDDVDETSDTAK